MASSVFLLSLWRSAREPKARTSKQYLPISGCFMKSYATLSFISYDGIPFSLRVTMTAPVSLSDKVKMNLSLILSFLATSSASLPSSSSPIYYLLGEDQIVHELIVYNPNIYALNCLRGNMDPVDLMKIHKPVKDKWLFASETFGKKDNYFYICSPFVT